MPMSGKCYSYVPMPFHQFSNWPTSASAVSPQHYTSACCIFCQRMGFVMPLACTPTTLVSSCPPIQDSIESGTQYVLPST